MDTNLVIIFLSSKQPRRLTLIKNLLMGKKTVSTWFWAMRYDLLQYSGLFKNKPLFNDEDIRYLVSHEYIILTDTKRYILTKKGQQKKDSFLESGYILENASKYYEYDVVTFKRRFLLLAQVISEYSYKNNSYYPITGDLQTEYLIKKWFIRNKNKSVYAFKNYISQWFNSLDNNDANIFVQLLVGHDNMGKTGPQIAYALKTSVDVEWLWELDFWIALIKYIQRDSNSFLHFLLFNIVKPKISNKAMKTYQLFCKSISLAQIAKQSHIKLSTVKEHLQECAIFMDIRIFPYTKILNSKMVKYLDAQYHLVDIDDWHYSDIENQETIGFFEFRIYQILRSKQMYEAK
jgi:uncharacterized protein YpbB